MTSLFISLIAIVLFSVVAVSIFLYFDADEAKAVGNAPLAASMLGNVVEASEAFRQARGNYPLSIEDLRTEFDLESLDALEADYIINDGVACLSMPYRQDIDDMLQIASNKFSGSVVTDTCGSLEAEGRRFLAFSLDGNSVPTPTPYTPDSIEVPSVRFSQTYTCGETPAAGESFAVRGQFLACYIRQVEAAANAMIDEGFSSHPSVSTMLAFGYLDQAPPSWPEISFIGATNNWRYGGTASNDAPRSQVPTYVAIIFDGSAGIGSKQSLARAVTTADGSIPNSNYYHWHVYTPPVYEYGDDVPQQAVWPWEGPVPGPTDDISLQADYIAYWFRKNYAAIEQMKADGRDGSTITSIAELYSSGYETAPSIVFDYDAGLGITTSGSRSFNGTPNLYFYGYYRDGRSGSLCNAVEERLYFKGNCGSYRSHFHMAYTTHR